MSLTSLILIANFLSILLFLTLISVTAQTYPRLSIKELTPVILSLNGTISEYIGTPCIVSVNSSLNLIFVRDTWGHILYVPLVENVNGTMNYSLTPSILGQSATDVGALYFNNKLYVTSVDPFDVTSPIFYWYTDDIKYWKGPFLTGANLYVGDGWNAAPNLAFAGGNMILIYGSRGSSPECTYKTFIPGRADGASSWTGAVYCVKPNNHCFAKGQYSIVDYNSEASGAGIGLASADVPGSDHTDISYTTTSTLPWTIITRTGSLSGSDYGPTVINYKYKNLEDSGTNIIFYGTGAAQSPYFALSYIDWDIKSGGRFDYGPLISGSSRFLYRYGLSSTVAFYKSGAQLLVAYVTPEGDVIQVISFYSRSNQEEKER